jgi:hypothetical protein
MSKRRVLVKSKILVISVAMLLAFGANQLAAAPPENSGDVIKHLEFLGYEVSSNSNGIQAKHSKNLNISLKKYRGGILATTFFRGSDYGKNNKSSWLAILNKLNMKAAAARYYIDGDGDLVIEGYYPGTYNKAAFSAFLEAYNLERNHLYEVSDEIKPYLQ